LDLPTLYKIVEIASGAGANDSIVS
jgi:hypothetical protein